MPVRLPGPDDFGPRPTPQSRERFVPDAASGATVGTTLTQIGLERMREEASFEAEIAQSQLITAVQEEQDRLESDPDWNTHSQRFADAMRRRRDSIASSLKSNSAARRVFDVFAPDIIARGESRVRAGARRQEIDSGRASLDQMQSANLESFAAAQDVGSMDEVAANMQRALRAAVDAGYVSRQEAIDRWEGWRQRSAEARIGVMPPDRQAEVLRSGEGLGRYLPADRRAQLLPGAERLARKDRIDADASAIVSVYAGSFREGTRALAQAVEQMPQSDRADFLSEVNQRVNQLAGLRREQHVDALARLEQLQASGDAGADALAAKLYDQGALTDLQYAGALGETARARQARAKDETEFRRVQSAFESGAYLDPKDDATSVGKFFSAQTQGVPPGSPQYTAAAVEVTKRTNVAPEPAISWARAHLLSGNPEQAATAADLYQRLQEASPQAFGYAVDDRSRALAAQITDATRAGAPPALAIEAARQNVSRPKAELDQLEARYRADRHRISQGNVSALRGLLNSDDRYDPGVFSRAPPVPIPLQAEFEQGVRRYFTLTDGNTDQARRLAFEDVKRKWGRTEVNGKPELMPFAPEAAFPGLTAPVIRADLARALNAHTATVRRQDGATGQLVEAAVNPHDVKLVPYEGTARTNGRTWRLGYLDEFGALDLLRDPRNQPLLYDLPVTADAFEAARTMATEGGVANAKTQRERYEFLRAHPPVPDPRFPTNTGR